MPNLISLRAPKNFIRLASPHTCYKSIPLPLILTAAPKIKSVAAASAKIVETLCTLLHSCNVVLQDLLQDSSKKNINREGKDANVQNLCICILFQWFCHRM